MEQKSTNARVGPAKSQRKTEARHEERFLVERRISIIYGQTHTPGWLVDCSRHGIRIASPLQLYRNDQFTILLQPQEQPIKYHYIVRHTAKLWGDVRIIGGEMTKKLNDADGNALLQLLRDRGARPVTP